MRLPSFVEELESTHQNYRIARTSESWKTLEKTFKELCAKIDLWDSSPFLEHFVPFHFGFDLPIKLPTLVFDHFRCTAYESQLTFMTSMVGDLSRELSSIKSQLSIVTDQRKNAEEVLLLDSLGFETEKAALVATGDAFGEFKTFHDGTLHYLAKMSELHRAYLNYEEASPEIRQDYALESNRNRRANKHMKDSEAENYRAFLDKIFKANESYSTKSAQLHRAVKQYNAQRAEPAHPKLKKGDFQSLKTASTKGTIAVGEEDDFDAIVEFMEKALERA